MRTRYFGITARVRGRPAGPAGASRRDVASPKVDRAAA